MLSNLFLTKLDCYSYLSSISDAAVSLMLYSKMAHAVREAVPHQTKHMTRIAIIRITVLIIQRVTMT